MEQNLSRRKFVKVAGGGIAGASLFSSSLMSTLAGAAPQPDAAAAPVDARKSGPPQPKETGWQMATPRLSTPWTNEVSPQNAHPEYPRPQMTRRHWLNLNGVWQFEAVDNLSSPPIGQNLSDRILVPYPIESALSGINKHSARMFYRRRFIVPNDWNINGGGTGLNANQRLMLHFDAVDFETTVWVNGNQVGAHSGGYNRFSFDITDALETDDSGRPQSEQEIVVGVFDPTDNGTQPLGKQRLYALNNPGGIYYTPTSGIWQTVWMEPVPAAHIDRLEATPNLDDNTLELTVHVADGETPGLQVIAFAYDENFSIVGSIRGAPNQKLNLSVSNPRLWSPDNPYLYGLRVELLQTAGSGQAPARDLVESYFGMRSIGLKKIRGKQFMALNGEFLFEAGPLDQGFWPDGIYTAPTDAGLKSDLVRTKKLGFNMVRKHVKVEPDRWYYYADRLGLLVWQDMPSIESGLNPGPDAQAEFLEELKTMVTRHQNFPSIVMWVVFNEGWGDFDTVETTQMVKQLDPSRLADQMSGTNVCNCSKTDGDVLDVHNYVGPGGVPQPEDDRASVIGEAGGYGLLYPNHVWVKNGSYKGYERKQNAAQFTKAYVAFWGRVKTRVERCGLSALVYTATTDVEQEIDGVLTYDRRIVKPNVSAASKATKAAIAASDDFTNPPKPPPGMAGLTGVGFWKFNQSSGDVAPDASANNNAGQLVNNPTWINGYSGNALQFNGNDQYVNTGASILDTTGNYSVAAIVWLDNKNGFHTAVSQSGPSSSEFFLQYSDADDRWAFSSTSVRALGRSSPQTGRWYHLVGVRDAYNSVLKLYVDGSLAGTANYCPGDAAEGNTLIGRAKFNGNPVDFWAGKIDNVHVYDRALPTGEVKELYQSEM